eukprot:2395948-Amphidinium_carterae.2
MICSNCLPADVAARHEDDVPFERRIYHRSVTAPARPEWDGMCSTRSGCQPISALAAQVYLFFE